jgi:hypothetical protein
MDDQLNMETIYRHERQRWMKEEAPRRSFRDMLTGSVPYWIVLVGLVLYGLSAPHTAGVFDKLTPGWGWIAPVGVEFGLLYAAFRRRLAHAEEEQLHWTLWALEILLFITAMLVNGAGSFSSVIGAVGLETLSFTAIAEGFGNLPATSQAALVMAVLSAFIIPIGALVAGDGLAILALERRTGSDFREQRWHEVEFTVIYRAVFVRYLQQQLPERDARQRAFAEVRGYLGKSSSSGVRLLSAGSGQTGQSEQGVNGHSQNGKNGTVKQGIRTFLDDHPGLDQQSINDVLFALKEAGVQGGRTSVGEVLAERKERVTSGEA